MNVILPCLTLGALGLVFGIVHMAAFKEASKDDQAKADPANPVCGASCATCGFSGCGFAAAGNRTRPDGGKPE